MDRRAFYVHQRKRLQNLSLFLLETHKLGLVTFLLRHDRTIGTVSDLVTVPTSLTENAKTEVPVGQFTFLRELSLLGGFSRHILKHDPSSNRGLCVIPQLVISVSSGTRTYSYTVDRDGSYNTENFFRSSSVKPEDQTSERICQFLKMWTSSTPTELESLKVPWNPFIVCRVLKSKILADPAWEFFRWVKQQDGYCHNVYTYTAMIDQFGKAKNYKAIESLVEEMQQEGCPLSVVTYSVLIHWYRHAKNFEAVQRVWEDMKDKACRPNVVAYTAYLTALVKENRHLEAMEVYRQMQESGCRPNIYTYTVLLNSLLEAGKVNVATDLFDKLGDVRCRPNSVTYNLLIGAHSKAGNTEKVLSLYKAMRESGVKASHETLGSVARSLEAVGMRKEALQLLNSIDDRAVLVKLEPKESVKIDEHHPSRNNHETSKTTVPDLSTRPVLLPKSAQLAGQLRIWGPETDEILENLSKKLKPPYVMNVLKELRKDAAVAWRFFQWAGVQEGYKHTQYTFMKMMEIVGRVTKDGSTELMDSMLAELQKEETTNFETFNTLIKCYSEFKNIAAAEEVLNRIKMVGYEPNEVTYTMMIDMYSRAGMHNKAMEMYEAMQKVDCKPSLHTHSVLIQSLARSGKLAEAETLFDSLSSLGHKPTVVTYTALMQALLNAREVERALVIFQRMKDNDVKPTRITLKILAKGLRCAGQLEEAEKIAYSLPYLRGMYAQDGESSGVLEGEKAMHDLYVESLESVHPQDEACAETVA